MARAISNKNVAAATFDVAEFDGDWLASFGKPELRGAWTIFGGSGSGKTTFVLRLAKYLSRFVRRVAVNSLEQGLSLSLQTAWRRVGMTEVGDRVLLLEREPYDELVARLSKRRSPEVVIIDSVHYWEGFRYADYARLRRRFGGKLFVFVAHEQSGEPRGSVAQSIRYDSDIKIRVEGFTAFVTTRYEDADKGEGGAPYLIWAEGAKRYHSAKDLMEERLRDSIESALSNGEN